MPDLLTGPPDGYRGGICGPEMAAAFLSTYAGIVEDDMENSAAYVKGWVDVLKVTDHRGWILRSASEAQRAANFILGEAVSAHEGAEQERTVGF